MTSPALLAMMADADASRARHAAINGTPPDGSKGTAAERAKVKTDRQKRVLEAILAAPGISAREISGSLREPLHSVQPALNVLRQEGRIVSKRPKMGTAPQLHYGVTA